MHREVFALHKELLKLRREDKTLKRMQEGGRFDAAVLSNDAMLFRFFGEAPGGIGDRLLLVNFGSDLNLQIAPEPLLAPPMNHRWAVLLSTEEPRFGGTGAPSPETELEGWLLTGRCASVMRALPAAEFTMETRVHVRGSAQAATRRPPRESKTK
jgi:maltooligosyltrehalose trehalohydrolase